jgi:peptidoglycan/xylan/chitin deacetylase (PgdA/CDA1 family)
MPRTSPTTVGQPGGFVVSLDFELHWGVREFPIEPRRPALLAARRAVPALLELFEEFDVAATWATVGMLFAETRGEMRRFFPSELPTYVDTRLNPYDQKIGEDEKEDPLHFAPSLIRSIQRCPNQEIASHTFSHYYCWEPGQKLSQFRADVRSAVDIAAAKGVTIRSIVLPRNQIRADYVSILPEFGIRAYRGVPRGNMWKPGPVSEQCSAARRLSRLLDAYVNLAGSGVFHWPRNQEPNMPCDIPASCYFRCHDAAPDWARPLHIARITTGLREAARQGRVFHLWAHPEDFAIRMDESLAGLRQILQVFRDERQSRDMRSLTMSQAAPFAQPELRNQLLTLA